MRLEILSPQAKTVDVAVKAALRPADLRGKRIGLYWNLKSGGDEAIARAAEILQERFPGVTVKRYWGEVGSLIRQATPEDIQKMAAECDAVIGATSD